MLCLDYALSPLIQMDVANRVAHLSCGHPGSTLSRTWGKKMLIETPGKHGDGVTLGGTVLVQNRHGKVAGLETCVLLLSLTPMVRRLYHEDAVKILGHRQMKDDYEECDKTRIVGRFECE